MALLTVVLTLLCVWTISAQGQVVKPKEMMLFRDVSLLCDAELAWVPVNSIGIIQLSLQWNNGYYYLTCNVDGTVDSNLKRHWLYWHNGLTKRTRAGYIPKSEINFKINLKDFTLSDVSVYCCKSIYVDLEKRKGNSTRCLDPTVKPKLKPPRTKTGMTFGDVTVYCSADLAGVPENAGIIYALSLHSQPYNTHGVTHYSNGEFRENIHYRWHHEHYDTKPLDSTLYLKKNNFVFEITITNFTLYDNDMFCCNGTFRDTQKRTTRLTYRCRTVISYPKTVLAALHHSTDGSSSLNGSLMFGILILLLESAILFA